MTSDEQDIAEDVMIRMRTGELLNHPLLNFLDETDYFSRDALDLVKYRMGQLLGLRGSSRPLARWQGTLGSPKWLEKHIVGCVLHAPESVCICSEFQKMQRPKTEGSEGSKGLRNRPGNSSSSQPSFPSVTLCI